MLLSFFHPQPLSASHTLCLVCRLSRNPPDHGVTVERRIGYRTGLGDQSLPVPNNGGIVNCPKPPCSALVDNYDFQVDFLFLCLHVDRWKPQHAGFSPNIVSSSLATEVDACALTLMQRSSTTHSAVLSAAHIVNTCADRPSVSGWGDCVR